MTGQSVRQEECVSCHRNVDIDILETVSADGDMACGECAEQIEADRAKQRKIRAIEADAAEKINRIKLGVSEDSCWCKCYCDNRYECDMCRMGDHITMTKDDWHEAFARADREGYDYD